MEDNPVEVEEFESASTDSFIDDSDNEEPSTSGQDDGFEEEIEELIAELLEVESKAAEAQESLEDESLVKVEGEVREELSQSLNGDDLEKAIADEMAAFREECETVLDELETESAHLLEQLDGVGIELPSLYKWIESQTPNVCSTETWKKRTHWVGSQMTSDVTESVADAEKYLQTHRPVRKDRRRGKVLEEGASGFLGKRLGIDDSREAATGNSDVDWCTFNEMLSSANSTSFGSKTWASVYLAETPQQAAQLGPKFPGVDEKKFPQIMDVKFPEIRRRQRSATMFPNGQISVEEIDDLEGSSSDPFVADAIKNENELNLSEEQKRNFRKVKEEDDVNVDRKLQLLLKRRRHRNRREQEATRKEVSSVDNLDGSAPLDPDLVENIIEDLGGVLNDRGNAIACQTLKNDVHEALESSNDLDKEKPENDGTSVFSGSALPDLIELRGSKRLHDNDEQLSDNKKSRIVTIDSDEEALVAENRSSVPFGSAREVVDKSNLLGNGNEDYHCTTCGKVAAEVHPHPLIEVIVCQDCKKIMEEKMEGKDPDCLECYCGWCGQNSDLVSCRSCKTLFCTACIQRNLGKECLLEVQQSGWKCCCCTPSILQRLTSQLEKAIASKSLMVSSSDSDSDDSEDSDEDVNVVISTSTKRRQKKKIRRILDDAELGEETKRKIAIEKERQDRLKCLEAKFSTKSMMKSSVSFTGNVSEGGTVEVLGDGVTGYIVNVVREDGEEAVRIPRSISNKLKAHQYFAELIAKIEKKLSAWVEGLLSSYEEGGGGARSMEDTCKAYAMNAWWNLNATHSLGANFMRRKYEKHLAAIAVGNDKGGSEVWRRMQQVRLDADT
ncbi:hypothetical protein LguiB_035577 [Lonicera macranthoides]